MMEENKDIIIEEAEETSVEVKKEKKNIFKELITKIKSLKSKKLRNQFLLKRGGYSVGIVALVLAVIILFNWLISALSQRFHLEFDMSNDKVNSMSEENIEYIKALEDEIVITVCANEDDYVSYINYYAQNMHNASGDTKYFEQTLSLVNKYDEYNDNITVKFVDPQTTEFNAISQNYSGHNITYGDIIVSCTKNNNERVKVVAFDDIYTLSDESGYAAMGYGAYTISGNKVETAVTSAIAYAVSSETKKAAIITGHSAQDYSKNYKSLLEINNYEVSVISDAILTSIPKDVDVAVIMAPTTDFIGSEIDVISQWLDNDAKLGKGLMFFADASSPSLPNLYSYLSQWGIVVGDGILFETNSQNHVSGDPTTMGIYPVENEDTEASSGEFGQGIEYCISGYNVPITLGEPADSSIYTMSLMETLESVAVAPSGVSAEWKDYTESDLAKYSGVAQAQRFTYDDDNEPISSYVMAFGSIEYIQSQYAEYDALSNKNVTLTATDRAAGVEESGISFVSKVIKNESYADKVTEQGSAAIRIIFMILLPIAIAALGVVVFIRRKNA